MARKAKAASAQLLGGLESLGEAERQLRRIKARTTRLLTGPAIDMRKLSYFLTYLQSELKIEVTKGE